MLNMIIAIMSDTFERVSNSMESTDGRELNSLILEQENLMFWETKRGESKYLHWVKNINVDNSKW